MKGFIAQKIEKTYKNRKFWHIHFDLRIFLEKSDFLLT